MVAWCLNPDGRRDRDECAKPTVGLASNFAHGNFAVFFMVRFQEKEMRKVARRKYVKKCGKVDISTLCRMSK
jgi:hypothetical protein